MQIEEFLSLFSSVHKAAGGWQAHCPAHTDDNPSLSIGIGIDNKIILKCHAGCSIESIVDKLGIKISDLFSEDNKLPKKVYTGTTKKETEFKYLDEKGNHVYSSIRIDIPGKPKTFVIRNGDKSGFCGAKPIIYNLHKVNDAIMNEDAIFIPEGEKKCDKLQELDLLGVCSPLGAGKWKDEYSKYLTWANIIILPDNDKPGMDHAYQVAESLKNCAKSLKILELPDLKHKEDVVDWLNKGGTKEKLLELADKTPPYNPEKESDVLNKIVFYYDSERKEYLYKNKRKWLSLTEGQFKKNLIDLGYSDKKKRNKKLSDVDYKLLELRENNDVEYVGGLAGYQKGLYEINEKRLLIIDSPKIIQPKTGSCETILGIVKGLLIDNDDAEQYNHFVLWLKIAYETLIDKSFRPGQVIVFAGERDCGKSLLQKIITVILGGRSAKPYRYMIGETDFNADLFNAEHLTIEDEVASSDIRSRRIFGAQIRQFTANEEHRCHAKFRQAITLKPFWRVSISLNDEPENLLILPPIDESLTNKIMIFHAYKKPMPMPTVKNEDRKLFWQRIISEIPAFIDYLIRLEVPDDMTDDFFGVKYFHNKYLFEEISMLAPEIKLLDLIDRCIFPEDGFTLNDEYVMTANVLENKLQSNAETKYDAGKLLTWNLACGTYLGRLANKYPERVQSERTSGQRKWKLIKGR